MKPTVVSLEGGTEGSEISFEQAFGEFSEARGRGRARRNKRKTERQQNRIVRRGERKKSRQQVRAEQQEARQSRRDVRKTRRIGRREMGADAVDSDSQTPIDDSGSTSGSGESDYGSNDGGQAPAINQEGDSTRDNQGNGQGEYQGEGGGYSEDEYEQNPEGADAVVDSEIGESDEESGFTGDCNFDGAIMLSPEDAEWNEYFSSAEGKAKINPKVKQLSLAIEKEKHLLEKLRGHIDRAKNSKNPVAKRGVGVLSNKIQRHTERLKNMETKLASYSRFEGDYSEARGGRREVARRKAEVRHAKRYARQERKQARRQERKRVNTPVEAGLRPEFQDQRIEVPEESSNFNGTGLIGLDEQGDIDAPETRKFDLIFSNADGDQAKKDKRKKLIIGVSVGVAVGVLAIMLIKKLGKK